MAANAAFSTDMVQGDETGWMTPEKSEELNARLLDEGAKNGEDDTPAIDADEQDDEFDAPGADAASESDEEDDNPRRTREKTPDEAKLARARRDKKRLQRELAEAQARNNAIEDRLKRIEQATVATQMRELEGEVNSLTVALENARNARKEARRDGDVDREDQIERAYEVLLSRKAQAEARLERAQQEVQQYSQPQPRQRPTPQLAHDWASRNQALVSDPGTFAAVRGISAALEREGYDVDDPDHYRELTARLRRAFPEKFPKSQSAPRGPSGGGSSPRGTSSGRDPMAGVNSDALRAYRATQVFKDNVSYAVARGMTREAAEKQELQAYAKTFRGFNS